MRNLALSLAALVLLGASPLSDSTTASGLKEALKIATVVVIGLHAGGRIGQSGHPRPLQDLQLGDLR